MKTFLEFMEEKEDQGHLRAMLLRRLGFAPKAMDDSTIKLRDLDKDKLKQAVASMGFDSNAVEQLQNWIENNPDTTLQNLISQVNGEHINMDDFGQSDIPEAPADLPLGQPKPERRPAPSMYGGGPPSPTNLT